MKKILKVENSNLVQIKAQNFSTTFLAESKSQQEVAVIIPFRETPEGFTRLKSWLLNLINIIIIWKPEQGSSIRSFQFAKLKNRLKEIFQEQSTYYRLFLVRQTFEGNFNKGKLLNIGFIEAILRKNILDLLTTLTTKW